MDPQLTVKQLLEKALYDADDSIADLPNDQLYFSVSVDFIRDYQGWFRDNFMGGALPLEHEFTYEGIGLIVEPTAKYEPELKSRPVDQVIKA